MQILFKTLVLAFEVAVDASQLLYLLALLVGLLMEMKIFFP
jgi:hypothetical protein